MFNVPLTEKQIEYLLGLLDAELKKGGLATLGPVVEVYSAMMQAVGAQKLRESVENEKKETAQ